MLYTAVFLLLTGAMVTAAATAPDPMRAARSTRQITLVLLAIICLGAALVLALPNGPWLYPAALSLNGAACVAHGVRLTSKLRVLSGFGFSVLGGMQLGLVLIMAIQAG
jgi:hypothetical protein